MTDVTLAQGVIVALIGLISGAIGSLVAPWVHWGIEKRRSKHVARIEKISSWRAYVDIFDFDIAEFGDTAVYAEMRPHLSESIIKVVESNTMFVGSPGRGQDVLRQKLADDISIIEKKWNLV